MKPRTIHIGGNEIVVTNSQQHGLIMLILMVIVAIGTVILGSKFVPKTILGSVGLVILVGIAVHLTGLGYSKLHATYGDNDG